jgi:hypothetical protein
MASFALLPMTPIQGDRHALILSQLGPYRPRFLIIYFNYFKISGGEGGIRTHGTREGSTVFETARFNRSRTSPRFGTSSVSHKFAELQTPTALIAEMKYISQNQ